MEHCGPSLIELTCITLCQLARDNFPWACSATIDNGHHLETLVCIPPCECSMVLVISLLMVDSNKVMDLLLVY